MWDEYLFPNSVKEALEMLKSFKGKARIIAGGTDLIPQLNEQTNRVSCLVDISRITELLDIKQEGDFLRIGSVVTHAELSSSPLVKRYAKVLAEAALAVGSPLIRNHGTLAGNIINAQPAADTAVALFSLEPQVEFFSINKSEKMSIDELYGGIGVSKIDSSSQIVTAIRFKCLGDNQGSSFQRLAQRKALALPMLNVAAVVTINNRNFGNVKLTIAPVAPMPFRSRKAEEYLEGAVINEKSINRAAILAATEAQPRDSTLRGSSKYRRDMVTVLVKRALIQATEESKR